MKMRAIWREESLRFCILGPIYLMLSRKMFLTSPCSSSLLLNFVKVQQVNNHEPKGLLSTPNVVIEGSTELRRDLLVSDQ